MPRLPLFISPNSIERVEREKERHAWKFSNFNNGLSKPSKAARSNNYYYYYRYCQ